MTVPLAHNKDNDNNNYTHHNLLPLLVARSVTRQQLLSFHKDSTYVR